MSQVRRWVSAGVVALVATATIVGTASAADVTVRALDHRFDPSTVTVKAGDTVTWVNEGKAAHTVTSSADDGKRFDRAIQPGQSTAITFSSAGTIDYFCRFHGTAEGSGMVGKVTVQAASSTGRTTARLAGKSRIETAVAVSKAAFPNGSSEVYLSNAEVNPDALVGGALTKGPILLVPSCGKLPPEVAAEIRRLGATKVVALGGVNAVCEDILRQAGNA